MSSFPSEGTISKPYWFLFATQSRFHAHLRWRDTRLFFFLRCGGSIENVQKTINHTGCERQVRTERQATQPFLDCISQYRDELSAQATITDNDDDEG